MNTAIKWDNPANADTLMVADGIAAEVANLRPGVEFAWVTTEQSLVLRVDAPDAYEPQFVWVYDQYGEVVVSAVPGGTYSAEMFYADTSYGEIAERVVYRLDGLRFTASD